MNIVARGMLFLVSTCLFASGSYAAPDAEPEGWTGPLQDYGIDGSLTSLTKAPAWQTKLISSHEGDCNPSDDRVGHWEFEGGATMADLTGPGVVTRIWSADPQGQLGIYVDDLENPILISGFRDLFVRNPQLELRSPGFNLFSPPFTGHGSGGYYSYVPIPYEKHCRIVVWSEEEIAPHQVNYVEFPVGTPIQSFELSLSDMDVAYFRDWAERWTDDNPDMRYHKRKSEKIHHSRHNFWPNKNAQILPIEGPGVITEIELKVGSADTYVLDNTWIAISFDDQREPGVLAPLGDFFGGAHTESGDYKTLVAGKHEGRMWCRFPMPFQHLAEIRLLTTSEEKVDVEYWVTWRPEEEVAGQYFFARYNRAVTEQGTPYTVGEITGEGHVVGVALSVRNARSEAYLDGAEKIVVDGASGTTHCGTGTDHYFNGGWHFSEGTSSSIAHAVGFHKNTIPMGMSAFRGYITDAIPFERSFTFQLDHGDANATSGETYSSVVYWYQDSSDSGAWQLPQPLDLTFRE